MSDFLTRYLAGEHEAVWSELTALGPRVRAPDHLEPARAVARETMRRARANIETIIERLDRLGYRFWDGVQGPRRGPPTTVMFGGGEPLGAPTTLALLTVMFEAARRVPEGHLTRLMIEQLHNIYRTGVWPWQDTSRLARGERHPADAAAVELLEAAKAAPESVDAARLDELERRTQSAAVGLHQAWQARAPAPAAAPAPIDHRKDKRVLLAPRKKDAAVIRRLEAKGRPVPLSLAAWIEEVGAVNLAGSHPRLVSGRTPAFQASSPMR